MHPTAPNDTPPSPPPPQQRGQEHVAAPTRVTAPAGANVPPAYDAHATTESNPTAPATTTTPATTTVQSPIVVSKPSAKEINVFCAPQDALEVEDCVVVQWHIPDYHALLAKEREYSPTFEFGDATWRLLLFPKGNRTNDTVSIFLDSVNCHSASVSPKWHVCAQFALVIQSPLDPSSFVFQNASHRFSPKGPDWGFNNLVNLREATTEKAPVPDTNGGSPLPGSVQYGWRAPLIANGETIFKVYIKKIVDETGCLWHRFENWDSKTETGFVGLKNQGATCYMNSLLQSLFFTNFYRRATFQIPTENDVPTNSIPLALQRIFYNLEFSPDAVSTNELTKSFGWDTMDSFMQHDVQEFNRVLQDSLENKMKGSRAEGAISKLFVGKMKSYIKCINVNFESSRVEDFYDIQLNVKGCTDLVDSFKNYIAEETLDGDNKYMAEGYGLQDARKGVVFKSFPPVLHLQLKRFEYDMMRDTMVKINDRHEFLPEIDLAPYLDDDADKSENHNYILHGVLVHSGDLHGGHYCAFIRPYKENKWFKFDDDRVIPAARSEVFEENFGGFPPANRNRNPNQKLYRRNTNAYMLVYIRESRRDQILAPITNDDIPQHLRIKMQEEREQAERISKEREEAHLYQYIKFLTDAEIAANTGFDLFNFTERNYVVTDFSSKEERDTKHDATNNNGNIVPYVPGSGIPSLRMKKKDTVGDLKRRIGNILGKAPNTFEMWLLVGRQNKTVRPDRALTDYYSTLEATLESYSKMCTELRLYIEDLSTDNLSFADPQNPQAESYMLYFKYFDVETGKMSFIGRYFVSANAFVGDLVPKVAALVGLPPKTELLAFEEVKPTMIDLLQLSATISTCELGDGDIICFQKDIAKNETLPFNGMVTYYYEYLLNRVSVTFKDKNNEKMEPLQLVLSKKSSHSDVTQALADAINAKIAEATNQSMATTPVGNSPSLSHASVGNNGALNSPNHQSPQQSPLTESTSNNNLHGENQASTIAAQYHLPVDPKHIALWPGNQYGRTSNSSRFTKKATLDIMLANTLIRRSDLKINELPLGTLSYEVLSIDAEELETKKLIKVEYVEVNEQTGLKVSQPLEILVPQRGTVADVVRAAKFKVGRRSSESTEDHVPSSVAANSVDTTETMEVDVDETKRKKLMTESVHQQNQGTIQFEEHLVAINRNRIDGVFGTTVALSTIPEYRVLQLHHCVSGAEYACTLEVFQFSKEPMYTHGVPFMLSVTANETFGDVKQRIRSILQMTDKDYSKSKFYILNRNLARVTVDGDEDDLTATTNTGTDAVMDEDVQEVAAAKDDSEVAMGKFLERESQIGDGPYAIGVDHPDRGGRTGASSRGGFERAIRINA